MSLRSQNPVNPSTTAGGPPLAPWLILGAVAAAWALSWLSWLAGQATAWLSGVDTGPGYGYEYLGLLVDGQYATLWPHVRPGWVAATYTVLLLATIVPAAWLGFWWQARRPQAGDPLPSLATPRHVAALLAPAIVKRAQRLRPDLDQTKPRKIDPSQTGIALGTLIAPRSKRQVLRASWEDVMLAIMAPRTGKTTALAVPPILQAPGAVLATSNRADVWAATEGARGRVGTTWTFDPQAITFCEQRFWIDLLRYVRTVEDATRVADHFAQEVKSSGGDVFWPLAASELLTGLFLAAAHSGGTLHDVQAWLSDPAARQPVNALRDAGFGQLARSIAGTQAGAPETRDSIYQTARTAARCLLDPQIMAWVTPPRHRDLPQLDLSRFAVTRDTLYALSKEGGGAAAPIIASVVDIALRWGVRHAEANGGRLPQPMLPVLDEAANVCKISDLPQLYSHLGGRLINPITILQNYAQGRNVWGDNGMAALWSASTVKLIGAGIDDPRHAEELSKLLGVHWVTTSSRNRDSQGYTSYSTNIQRMPIMEPGQIREIPTGQALLLATGCKPAMIELMPWYRGPLADTVSADETKAVAAITTGAQASLNNLPTWKGLP